MISTFTPSHRGGSGPPLVCLHGFTDTWRTWELVLPALERRHDVFAPTLPGHAGGPAIEGEITHDTVADAVERAMDEAGIEAAHLAGNSLGGFVALQLAARGRAISVVALAPAGGWAADDPAVRATHAYFTTMQELLLTAAPHVDAIVASPEGRRRATEFIATNYEQIPAELIAHLMQGAAASDGALPMIDFSLREGWVLNGAAVTCPIRVVWGTADRVLPLPQAAVRFLEEWIPQAEWVELEGIGHCPQLDVPLETAELILGMTQA